MPARVRAPMAALALAAAARAASAAQVAPAVAGDDHAVQAPAARGGAWPWRFELKHLMTDRGSTEERTRTTVRMEKLLDAPVALLRADVPYVDKRNAFTSDPTDAGLGDVKCRVGFRGAGPASARLNAYVEVVLPTAASSSLGGGKWQVAPGVTAAVPVPSLSAAGRSAVFLPKVQQYVSVAGDPDRADVNYSSTELKLEAGWPAALLSVNPKPVIDWTAGVRTAAVLEVQGTWLVSRAWRLWAKPGVRLWGPALPATYDRQLELGVRLTL